MTHSWSYRPEAEDKSVKTMLTMLVQIVSRGGNFLLNVGPGPDGTLEETAYERLKGIGDWMQVNAEGIYATKAVAPYQDGQLYYTAKGDCVYAFYVPGEGEPMPAEIAVPSFVPAGARDVMMLGSRKALKWKKAETGGIVVTIPASLRKTLSAQPVWCLKMKVK